MFAGLQDAVAAASGALVIAAGAVERAVRVAPQRTGVVPVVTAGPTAQSVAIAGFAGFQDPIATDNRVGVVATGGIERAVRVAPQRTGVVPVVTAGPTAQSVAIAGFAGFQDPIATDNGVRVVAVSRADAAAAVGAAERAVREPIGGTRQAAKGIAIADFAAFLHAIATDHGVGAVRRAGGAGLVVVGLAVAVAAVT